jgi:hypothetical protein
MPFKPSSEKTNRLLIPNFAIALAAFFTDSLTLVVITLSVITSLTVNTMSFSILQVLM